MSDSVRAPHPPNDSTPTSHTLVSKPRLTIEEQFNQRPPPGAKKPPPPEYGNRGQYKNERDAPGGNLGDRAHSGRSAGDEWPESNEEPPDTSWGDKGGADEGWPAEVGNRPWDEPYGGNNNNSNNNNNGGWNNNNNNNKDGGGGGSSSTKTIPPDPAEPDYSADVWQYIHYGARNGDSDPETLRRRISQCYGNIDPRSSVCYYTPLHVAVKFVQVEGVRQLLAARADVNAQDFLGQTPLSLACCYGGATDIPRMLLDAGANTEIVDRYSWRALFWAAWHGFYHVSVLLVGRGASRSVRDKRDKTAADWASNQYIRNEIK